MRRYWSLKRVLTRLGLSVLGLLASLLFTNAILNWRAGARLEAKLSQLRAAGAPTTISDLAPTPVDDEKNAAWQLQALASQLESFSQRYQAFSETELGKALQKRIVEGAQPTDEQCVAIEVILDQHSELSAGLRRAAQCDQYASLLDFSLDHPNFVGHVINAPPQIRTAARMLDWRMEASIAEGDSANAVSTGIEMIRLSRLYEHEPTMVSCLVAISCRGVAGSALNHALRGGTIPAEIRDQLNSELSTRGSLANLQEVFRQERAVGLDALANHRQHPLEAMFGWRYANWKSSLIDCHESAIGVVDEPWHSGYAQLCRFMKTADYPPVVQLLLPAIEATYTAANRDIANLRCLRIVNELARYRDDNGHEASGLADLSIPHDETIDPFTGKPLIVKLTPEGWLIYSASVNGVDDEGDFTGLLDWGLAP